MNKKQLREAVELVRATYSKEELETLELQQFRARGLTLGGSIPIEEHLISIASCNEDRIGDYDTPIIDRLVHRALAAHHPSRIMRWYYRQWWSVDKGTTALILGCYAVLGVCVGLALWVLWPYIH